MTQDWRWLLGRDDPPPPSVPLRAGRLEAELAGLDLFDLRLDGFMILRRLAIRVRGAAWETLPHRDPEIDVRAVGDGTLVALAATSRGHGIDLAWRAAIQIGNDGTLAYDFEGSARGECRYNRIGIVALFPLTIAGRPYRARQAEGASEGTLPMLVGPQAIRDGVEFPLFPAFDRLEIDLADGLVLSAALAGDLFEMEDQRNWTDGTFKLYSTPLATPLPMNLEKGATLRQHLRLSFAGAPPARPGLANKDPIVLACGPALDRRMPPLGVALDRDGHEPDRSERALVHGLGLAHVRATISGEDTGGEALARAGRGAAQLGAPLELALVFRADHPDIGLALAALAPRLAALSIARLILLPEGDSVTPAHWLGQARAALGDRVPFAIGTGGGFVELNRRRPTPFGDTGLAYGANPQVHDDDERALIQSPAGQGATVLTAKSFAPDAPVHVGPITLKQQASPSLAPAADALPADVDPRQASVFAAAWLAASVKHLAEAGAASLTYFEATGTRGIVARTSGTPLPSVFPSMPGAPFPVFHMFEKLCPWRGAPLIACVSSEPEKVAALVVAGPGAWRALVWSFALAPLEGRLTGVASGRYRLARLTPAGWADHGVVSPDGGTLAVHLTAGGMLTLESA